MNTVTVRAPSQDVEEASRLKKKDPGYSWDGEDKDAPLKVAERDYISDLVGLSLYIADYSRSDWDDPRSGRRLIVLRYYPHKNLIVDFPSTRESLESKRAFFSQRGVGYMWVAPGETLTMEQFKERLESALRKESKHVRKP